MSETEKIEEVSKAEEENASKSKQKPKPGKQKPVDSSENGVDEEEEDDAQKIMNSIVSLGTKFVKFLLCCFKCILSLVKQAFGCVRSALGAVFGLGIFMCIAYVMRHFLLEEVTEAEVPDFESRLKFLLRNEIWPVLPVFLAAAVGGFSKNEVHAKFSRDRFEQALLFLFNLLLLSTHLENECLTWVRACSLLNCAFSLLHWFCLTYTKKRGGWLGRSVTHLNFFLMAYNVYILLGEDLGYLYLTSEATVASIETQTETSSGWF